MLVPAWNEAAVLRFSVDRMMDLDYPAGRLRLVVVDDASTDETPHLMAERSHNIPAGSFTFDVTRGARARPTLSTTAYARSWPTTGPKPFSSRTPT